MRHPLVFISKKYKIDISYIEKYFKSINTYVVRLV